MNFPINFLPGMVAAVMSFLPLLSRSGGVLAMRTMLPQHQVSASQNQSPASLLSPSASRISQPLLSLIIHLHFIPPSSRLSGSLAAFSLSGSLLLFPFIFSHYPYVMLHFLIFSYHPSPFKYDFLFHSSFMLFLPAVHVSCAAALVFSTPFSLYLFLFISFLSALSNIPPQPAASATYPLPY